VWTAVDPDHRPETRPRNTKVPHAGTVLHSRDRFSERPEARKESRGAAVRETADTEGRLIDPSAKQQRLEPAVAVVRAELYAPANAQSLDASEQHGHQLFSKQSPVTDAALAAPLVATVVATTNEHASLRLFTATTTAATNATATVPTDGANAFPAAVAEVLPALIPATLAAVPAAPAATPATNVRVEPPHSDKDTALVRDALPAVRVNLHEFAALKANTLAFQ